MALSRSLLPILKSTLAAYLACASLSLLPSQALAEETPAQTTVDHCPLVVSSSIVDTKYEGFCSLPPEIFISKARKVELGKVPPSLRGKVYTTGPWVKDFSGLAIEEDTPRVFFDATLVGADHYALKHWHKAFPRGAALTLTGPTIEFNIGENALVVAKNSYWQNRADSKYPLYPTVLGSSSGYGIELIGNLKTLNFAGKVVGTFKATGDNLKLNFTKGFVVGEAVVVSGLRDYLKPTDVTSPGLNRLQGVILEANNSELNFDKDFVTFRINSTGKEEGLTNINLSAKVYEAAVFAGEQDYELKLNRSAAISYLFLTRGFLELTFDPAIIDAEAKSCKWPEFSWVQRKPSEINFSKEKAETLVQAITNTSCNAPFVHHAGHPFELNKQVKQKLDTDPRYYPEVVQNWPALRLNVPEGQTWTIDLSNFITINDLPDNSKAESEFQKRKDQLVKYQQDVEAYLVKLKDDITKIQQEAESAEAKVVGAAQASQAALVQAEQLQEEYKQAKAESDELDAKDKTERKKLSRKQQAERKQAQTERHTKLSQLAKQAQAAVAAAEQAKKTHTNLVNTITSSQSKLEKQEQEILTYTKSLQQAKDDLANLKPPKPVELFGKYINFSRIEKTGPGRLVVLNRIARHVPTRIFVEEGLADLPAYGVILEPLDYFNPRVGELVNP